MVGVSWELRWFFSGEIPQSISSWFEHLDESRYIIREEPREDNHLLPLKAGENIGIKFREGRVEIKCLKQAEPFVLSAERLDGSAENWLKWTWIHEEGLNGADLPIFAEYPEGPIIKIKKKRRFRIYGALSSGSADGSDYTLHPLPARPDEGQGSLVELTSLRVRNEYWWSTAFETFGSGDPHLVKLAAVKVLSRYTGPPLTKDNSYGYPKWLAARL